MLIKTNLSSLLIIDVQEKLTAVMNNIEGVIENILILKRAAHRLSIPQLTSEQYPEGLGRTQKKLNDGDVVHKINFSCMADEVFEKKFLALNCKQAVIVGIESHICVLQTAIDLLKRDIQVFVVADGTTSRHPDSHDYAMKRLLSVGVGIVTTEMVLFEWLEKSGTSSFRELTKFIK